MRHFLPAINELVTRYQDKVTFAFIYIMEAHAIDEWPFTCINEDVCQHKNIHDRAAAARKLLLTFTMHESIILLLDNETNDFNNTYSSWPFRYWVVGTDGILKLKLMPEIDQVSMVPLEQWLYANIHNDL